MCRKWEIIAMTTSQGSATTNRQSDTQNTKSLLDMRILSEKVREHVGDCPTEEIVTGER